MVTDSTPLKHSGHHRVYPPPAVAKQIGPQHICRRPTSSIDAKRHAHRSSKVVDPHRHPPYAASPRGTLGENLHDSHAAPVQTHLGDDTHRGYSHSAVDGSRHPSALPRSRHESPAAQRRSGSPMAEHPIHPDHPVDSRPVHHPDHTHPAARTPAQKQTPVPPASLSRQN